MLGLKYISGLGPLTCIGLKYTPGLGPKTGPIDVYWVETYPRAGSTNLYNTWYFGELTKLCASGLWFNVSGIFVSKARDRRDRITSTCDFRIDDH